MINFFLTFLLIAFLCEGCFFLITPLQRISFSPSVCQKPGAAEFDTVATEDDTQIMGRPSHLLLEHLSLGTVQHSGDDLCHFAWESVPLFEGM